MAKGNVIIGVKSHASERLLSYRFPSRANDSTSVDPSSATKDDAFTRARR